MKKRSYIFGSMTAAAAQLTIWLLPDIQVRLVLCVVPATAVACFACCEVAKITLLCKCRSALCCVQCLQLHLHLLFVAKLQRTHCSADTRCAGSMLDGNNTVFRTPASLHRHMQQLHDCLHSTDDVLSHGVTSMLQNKYLTA